MKEKLAKLYNTLSNIETKGENTKIMGVCLQYLEHLISESSSETIDEDDVKTKSNHKTKSKKTENN